MLTHEHSLNTEIGHDVITGGTAGAANDDIITDGIITTLGFQCCYAGTLANSRTI